MPIMGNGTCTIGIWAFWDWAFLVIRYAEVASVLAVCSCEFFQSE
jgi:hypothetical protein